MPHLDSTRAARLARLGAMFDASPIGLTVSDAGGRFLECNAAFERLTGYSADELRGQSIAKLSDAGDADESLRLRDELVAGRFDHFALTKRYRRKCGALVWVRVTVVAVRAPDGRFEHSIGMVEDITGARRTAEALRTSEGALRSSEALYRSITEHSADLISIVGPDGAFRYVSPSVERTLGWTPDEFITMRLPDLVHPDDAEQAAATLRSIMSEPGGTGAVRLRVRNKHGGWRVMDGSGTNLLDDPSIAGVVTSSRDVTDKIEAEEHLRFQAHVLDSIDKGVVVTDRDARVIFWNRFAERLLRREGANLQGTDYWLAFPSPNADDKDRYERLLRGEEVAPRERMLQRHDGSEFLASIIASPFRDEHGIVIGVLAIITDITERRELEEQLRQSQKMEAIGQLAGGVAHDFNNILTVISGNAELLRAAQPGSERWRDDVDELLQAAGRASRLTRQLLAFGRKQMISPKLLGLDHVVSGVAPMLERLIGEDIELVVRGCPDLPVIQADPSQLEQILVNLVVNARDAMPDGGELVISTRSETIEKGSALARDNQAAGRLYAVLSVSDSGLGIDPQILPRIFEPFFTTKEVGKGSGLGLATVYGIAKQGGGFVTVHSKPNSGTRFDVYLPALAGEASAPAPAPPAERDGRGSETILLVEDSDAVRHLAERVLREYRYRVLAAPSGAEALRLAAEHAGEIDLLLTDVVMPGMSGREVSEALTAQQPGLRTLYMSGYTDDVILRKGLDVPGERVAFLEKPFTAQGLADRVRALLD